MSDGFSHVAGQASLPAHIHLPQFSGVFSTEETTRNLAADDFGRYVHRLPLAVLKPAAFDDVVRVVQFARQHGLKVAPRGQGHSTHGQAQVEAGIIVDTTSLNTIHALHADRVDVEAGALWSTVLRATLEQGLTPPVLPDYLDLSIGGTLAVGGVGGTSYRYGAIVDNVLELQVVTGEGKLETCSPNHQPELFAAVLAGLGQCGILVKATLRLIPAKRYARVFHLFYPNLAALIHDDATLITDGRFDYVQGYVLPTPHDEWSYVLEVVSFYTPPADQPDNAHLLSGLSFITGTEQIEEKSYFDFSNRVVTQAAVLKEKGVWHHPHPWFDVFVPASEVEHYVSVALTDLSPNDFGLLPILLSALNTSCFHSPLLRLPTEETVFAFDILRTVTPNPEGVAKAVAHNRQLFEHNRALGGTHYPISTIELSHADWERHFGQVWEQFLHAKRRFDPDNVLTLGQGIFPI
ncbi:MAG: FAD-binding protein [Ktedonobacteraceae bacterium]|nr:FAD-binding protein [Ktedonobacteraceae bacterium]